jgi:predicted nuclease of predicted toxin-antitoxin system
VKLLFDQNLSHRLVPLLADVFPGSEHVRNVGLREADDETVWSFAATDGFMIVTKDEDFHARSLLRGFPPKIIWILAGNCATDRVEVLLRRNIDEVKRLDNSPDTGVLELL